MQIVVNGAARKVAADSTVASLLAELEIRPEMVAVEHNRDILGREKFAEARLGDGDTIEIIQFVGGGAACTYAKQGVRFHG